MERTHSGSDPRVEPRSRESALAEVDASAVTLDLVSAADLSLSAGIPGRVGNFVLLDRLGSGGMGVVFAAYDTVLDRKVAVKLLHARIGDDRSATDRLLREAQAMARVSHPNVAPIYEVGAHDGRVFVAMELIDGPTLRAWQEAEERPIAALLELYVQAGRGLQAAHEAGIVHRDFKPDNVLVGGDGRVRVVDFGLARSQGTAIAAALGDGATAAPANETATRGFAGTPAYMSPEQFTGGVIDARSDQFSYAVALYEALVGARPFAGERLLELMEHVILGKVEPPPAESEVPEALLGVLRRALAREPGARWPTMNALLVELERFRGGDPSAAPRLRRRVTVAMLGSTVVVTGFLNYRAFAERTAVSHAELIGAVLSGVVVVGAIGVFARKTLTTNDYHRRVYLLLVVLVSQLLAFRVIAAMADLSLVGTYLLDLLGIAAVTGSAAVFALRWFGWREGRGRALAGPHAFAGARSRPSALLQSIARSWTIDGGGGVMRTARTRILPASGRAIISTDIHGNYDDFAALHRRFVELRVAGVDAHWVLLGDLVHGPSAGARRELPELYDYEDASPRLVEDVLELRRALPDRVHVILGNHDHGHVGGPATHRFHVNEAQALESRCTPGQRAAIRELFGEALLAVVAPCGLLLAHGCPDDRLERFADLDEVSLIPNDNSPYHRHLLATFTRSYGQPEAVVRRLLRAVSQSAAPVQMMVHGHERDESGWYSEGEHHLCPILFGAPAPSRRYLEVDLAAPIGGVMALLERGGLRSVHASE